MRLRGPGCGRGAGKRRHLHHKENSVDTGKRNSSQHDGPPPNCKSLARPAAGTPDGAVTPHGAGSVPGAYASPAPHSTAGCGHKPGTLAGGPPVPGVSRDLWGTQALNEHSSGCPDRPRGGCQCGVTGAEQGCWPRGRRHRLCLHRPGTAGRRPLRAAGSCQGTGRVRCVWGPGAQCASSGPSVSTL